MILFNIFTIVDLIWIIMDKKWIVLYINLTLIKTGRNYQNEMSL